MLGKYIVAFLVIKAKGNSVSMFFWYVLCNFTQRRMSFFVVYIWSWLFLASSLCARYTWSFFIKIKAQNIYNTILEHFAGFYALNAWLPCTLRFAGYKFI